MNILKVIENDWLAILETLYLISIPKMSQSIQEGLQSDIKDCINDIDW